MVKYLILIILLFSACSSRDNGGYEPLPDVRENAVLATPAAYPEPPLPPDIPQYNEYNISLEIDPETRRVQGLTQITFTNRSGVALDDIVLHVYLNAFRENAYPPPVFAELEWRAFPNGRDYGYLDIHSVSLNNEPLEFDMRETILTLELFEPIEPYATVQIFLQYTALIPQIAHRTGGNEYAMWFGMFLPVLAVYDVYYGWLAHPHYAAGNPFVTETANYRVEIITPIRYTVVGTGIRTEEVIPDTDTRITGFTALQARDFAFAVSEHFHHAHTSTESGIDIHFYYYTYLLDVDEILDVARRSVEYFESRVGTFPPGHVTIVETEMLQDSVAFSQVVFVDSWYLGRGRRFWAVAHGLGNQWFSNLIGTNRVAEPWLTEGLTRFVQAGIFYPSPEALSARMESDRMAIANRTTMYINLGLYASPNWEHYVHTHGHKAMLMIYELYIIMGGELFWQFISEYYQMFSFEIASVSDFIKLAEEIYGESLYEFFDEWLTTGHVPSLPPTEGDYEE